MVARDIGSVAGRRGGSSSPARRQKQHRPDAPARQTSRRLRPGIAPAVFTLPLADVPTGPPPAAVQMSFLVDTDLLSFLERKRVPAKLVPWLAQHDADLFVSVVSFAELEYGLRQAPSTHR